MKFSLNRDLISEMTLIDILMKRHTTTTVIEQYSGLVHFPSYRHWIYGHNGSIVSDGSCLKADLQSDMGYKEVLI